MKISYLITVCNETSEVLKLINFINTHKQDQDEIGVLLDKPKASDLLIDELKALNSKGIIKYKEDTFNGDFSQWKNLMNSLATGDYIVNFDADETPHKELLINLPFIIENNLDIDLIWVPRINTLEGDGEEVTKYVISQKWTVSKEGWINWPHDIQGRIYKNSPHIFWGGKVHEKIVGYSKFAKLPSLEKYSIYHPKTLEKQIKQNEFYNKI